jgi:tripartite-type tricarboxylate transporter receptor subunit TctC
LTHIRNGKLRALGVSMPKRVPELPDVPAIAETLSGYAMYSWAGVMLPAGVPPAAVEKLHASIVAVLAQQETAKRLRELGFTPVGSTPRELTEHCRKEIEKYAKLVRSIGVPQQ